MNTKNNREAENEMGATLLRLFCEGWVLSDKILGIGDAVFVPSERHAWFQVNQEYFSVQRDKKELWIISIPKKWIVSWMVYDVFFRSESQPRYRFRIGENTKVRAYHIKSTSWKTTDDMEMGDVGPLESVIEYQDRGKAGVYFSSHLTSPMHIKISSRQTIGKREAVMDAVKKVAARLSPHREK